MKKKLLLLGCMFLSFGAMNAQNTSDEVSLVSENVKVATNGYYNLFINHFDTKMKEAVKAGKKIIVNYFPTDETFVTSLGNMFTAAVEGTSTVEMKISTAKEGTSNVFDPDNILATKTFTVVAEDYADMPELDLTTAWGQSRKECTDAKTKDGKFTLATDEYFSMTPGLDQNYIKKFEVYFSNEFELPFRMCQFNESQDQLIAESIIVASFDRLKMPKISPIYKLLAKNGFEGSAETDKIGAWTMYNKTTKTEAGVGMMFLQGSFYYSLNMSYNPDGSSIESTLDFADVNVRTEGETMYIDAAKYAGKDITVFDLSGKVIAREVASEAGNQFSGLSKNVVLVQVEGYKPFKVMPW